MTFFRSILTLAAVCLCIVFAYFLGHALSTHHVGPAVWGLGLLIGGVAIIAFLSRDRVRG